MYVITCITLNNTVIMKKNLYQNVVFEHENMVYSDGAIRTPNFQEAELAARMMYNNTLLPILISENTEMLYIFYAGKIFAFIKEVKDAKE